MIGDRDTVLYQVLDSLVIQRDLAMAGEMFEMRLYYRCSLPDDIFHDRLLIVGNRFPLNDADCALRTGANAGTKTVTKKIADKPCLAIDQLNGSLRAVRDALATPCASGIINTDYVPFHRVTPCIIAVFLTAHTPYSPVHRRGCCQSSISAPSA